MSHVPLALPWLSGFFPLVQGIKLEKSNNFILVLFLTLRQLAPKYTVKKEEEKYKYEKPYPFFLTPNI